MELYQLSERVGAFKGKAAGPACLRIVTDKLAESLIKGRNSG